MLEILVMPMMGMGVFGSSGPGMKGAVAALLAQLVYGASLGGITGWNSARSAFDCKWVRPPKKLLVCDLRHLNKLKRDCESDL